MNGLIVGFSDASGSTYGNVSLDKIKNQPFPERITNIYSSSAPTSGYWAINDVIGIIAPTTWEAFICVVEGRPGTWKICRRIP